MNKQTVEEVLSEYPKEIVDFFQSEMKLDGWVLEKRLGSYLPSPAQQFINKFNKKENEETYEIIFTLNRRKMLENK